jgi:hypothetical protein
VPSPDGVRGAKPLSKARSPIVAAAVLALVAAALPLPHLVRDAFAILALALVAVAAWEPRTGLVLLLAYLPLRLVAEALTPVPITFLPDVVVLVLVGRVLWLHPDDVLPLDAIEWFALAFGVWGLVATVHAHEHLGGAVLEARDLLLFVVLYAAVRRLRRAGDGVDGTWWLGAAPFALASVALVGVQGMVQTFVLGHAFLLPAKLAVNQLHVSGVNAGRPYGWLDNPNVFGELGFFALLVTYDIARRRAFRPSWPLALAAALFAAMIVLSFSRSTYIVVLVAAAIVAYGVRSRSERTGIAVAVAAMAVAVALIPGARVRALFGRPVATTALSHPRAPGHGHGPGPRPPAARGGVGTTAAGHGRGRAGAGRCTSYVCISAKAGRLHNLRVALHLVRHHPFGTGLGTFGSAGAKVFHVHLKGLPANFYADNQYTVVLVETGLPGALLFALLGVATFLAILRMRDDDGAHDRRVLLVLFVSMVILGATSNAWEQLVLTIYPWLGLAVLWRPGRRGDRTTSQDPPLVRQAIGGHS